MPQTGHCPWSCWREEFRPRDCKCDNDAASELGRESAFRQFYRNNPVRGDHFDDNGPPRGLTVASRGELQVSLPACVVVYVRFHIPTSTECEGPSVARSSSRV